MSLLAKLRTWWSSHHDKRVVAISAFCAEDGSTQFIWLGDEEIRHHVKWEQIESVIAYKRDLYAYDEICVALLDERGEVLVYASEESGSFGAFINGLPKWLTGCKTPEEWWNAVAHPAFERNETELYRRHAPLVS